MTDAREYLESIRETELRLQMRRQQLQTMKDRLLCITPAMDQELVSHTRNVNAMGDSVAMILDLEKEIDQETKEFMLVKLKALSLMNLIAPEHIAILIERFLEAKTFPEIGKTLYVTERQAQRRLKKAVTEYQRVLNESESN